MITETINLPKTNINLVTNYREGKGENILFIHGLGCSKESFDNAFITESLNTFGLIAPDLPGFGRSSKNDDILFEMSNQAEYLKILLDLLNITNPIVVAHSMGGAIALLLIDKLKSVKHFFCLEGNLIDADCTISKKVASLTQEDFVQNKYIEHHLKYRCRGLSSEPEANPIAFYKSSISLVELSETGQLLDKYLALDFPKTYIYGEENKLTKIVGLLSGEDVVEINGCGHFMMTDNSEATYTEIQKRLS